MAKAKRGTAAENVAALRKLPSSGRFTLAQRVVNVPGMISATLRGQDTGVSRWRLAATALGAAYVLSPLDFLPEALLGPLGLGDDGLVAAAMATFLLTASDAHLQRLRNVAHPAQRQAPTAAPLPVARPARKATPKKAKAAPAQAQEEASSHPAPKTYAPTSTPPPAQTHASPPDHPVPANQPTQPSSGCPSCGGHRREPIAPGYWRCVSEVVETFGGPGLTNPMRGPMVVEYARLCGHEYNEGPGAGPSCKCGTFAIGQCAECSMSICGDHSGIRGNRRLCGSCAKRWRIDAETPARDALFEKLRHHHTHGKLFIERHARRVLREAEAPTVELVKIAPGARRPLVSAWGPRIPLIPQRRRDVGEDTQTRLVREALGWDLGVHTFRWDTDKVGAGGSVKEKWHAVLLTERVPGEMNDMLIIRAASERIDEEFENLSGKTMPLIPAGPGRLFLQPEAVQRGTGRYWLGATWETFASTISKMAGLPSWTPGSCGCSEEARRELTRDDEGNAHRWVDEDPRFAALLSDGA